MGESRSSLHGPARTRCPLCGSADIGRRYTITRFARPFTIDRCSRCAFMFMNPPFTDNAVRQLYGSDYYSGRSDYSYMDERAIEPFAMHVWKNRLKFIARRAPQGNFLDIGAAFGGLMKAARQHFIPHGIELSDYAGSAARELFGERLHIGTLRDHPFPGDSFAAITMIELIEHIDDPLAALRECHRLLRKDGLLVIQTANMRGRQAKALGDRYDYFMPGHLSYFSKSNLCEALRRCGFTSLKVYYPVEFGLIPKLLKSRHAFESMSDYRAWLRIAWYHVRSKIHLGDFAMTSSMVVYAKK